VVLQLFFGLLPSINSGEYVETSWRCSGDVSAPALAVIRSEADAIRTRSAANHPGRRITAAT
jgi:hypothetical protein